MKVVENSGCTSLKEFKNLPVEQVFAAFNKTKEETKIIGMLCSPVVDGQLILNNEYEIAKKGLYECESFLIGSTSEDIIPPIMYRMSKKWAKLQSKDSYVYLFNQQLQGDENGAWHSSDLWYRFGTLDNCWRPMREEDYKLSNIMSSYLTNFVKTGDPNGVDLTTWDSAKNNKSKVMYLCSSKLEMSKVSTLKLWYNMFAKKAVGE